MMKARDPKRIKKMLELVRAAWEANPDLRLTQLLLNLVPGLEPNPKAYYFEDDLLEEQLRCFLKVTAKGEG